MFHVGHRHMWSLVVVTCTLGCALAQPPIQAS